MHRRKSAALAALLVLAMPALAAPKPAAAPRPETLTLDNGLKIIVQEDHSAPVVALVVGYRAGSRNERDGIRGIAHLFEHMMFKGSKSYGPDVMLNALESVGAQYNAFTTEDETVYHELVPKEALGRFLAMEADRMGRLQLTEEMLVSEREVVKEEYRVRIQNQPISTVYEAYLRKAYVKHPYAYTPAGTLDDLDKIQLSDCLDFYKTYYAPNNAVLVVVGDTTLKEVTALAKQEFGPLKRQRPPPAVTVVEPPQKQRRDVALQLDAQLPILIGGFHVPSGNHPDADALAILSSILSEGESSRLHQSLVREQRIAPFAAGQFQASRDPGMFIVFAGYLPPRTAKEVETALLRELAELRDDGVLEEEMQKAKNQAISSKAFEQLSQTQRAVRLTSSEIVEGSYTRALTELSRLERVTAEQVRKVARKYLVESNLTLAVLEPKGAAEEPSP
ncbi:MAG TPA: pitrilysin family protein [Myxococcaceae bacterium]|nr:pitrilysin family protein [Myxococcaceae bacterium]